jgi:hypothetical protein
VQDDLLKKLVKIQSYLKRVHYATNFNLTAVSDEAYSEKITGWVMECLIKLDTSSDVCIDYKPRFVVDNISKFDRQTYSIIECLLPAGSEVEFPDYTYFLQDSNNPVDYINNTVFRNMKFYGNFYMNNLKKINDYEFYNSVFQGYFRAQNVESVGRYSFTNSKFIGNLNLPKCEILGREAFANSKFTGNFYAPKCKIMELRAFANSKFTGNFYAPKCEILWHHAFYYSNFSGSLSLPVCTQISDAAFQNSNFNKITIGANATLGNYCIGAHSAEFGADYAANNKKAGTYVWNGQHWIYQT